MGNRLIGIALLVLVATNAFFIGREILPSDQKIVYIKSAEVLEGFEKTKELRDKFELEVKEYNDKHELLKTEFRGLLEQFERKQATLSPEELRLNRELLKTKQEQLKTFEVAIREKIGAKDLEITNELLKEINSLLEDFGKQKGYEIILGANSSGNVVFGEQYLDVTEDVIEFINK